MIGGLRFCSFGGQASASNPHLCTATFGVDCVALVTVISPNTASDSSRERGAMKAMRDCTGRLLEDKYLVIKGPLGTTFVKTTVAPVLKNLLPVVDTGHEVTFKEHQSCVWRPGTGRWPLWDQGLKTMWGAASGLGERLRDAVARGQEVRDQTVLKLIVAAHAEIERRRSSGTDRLDRHQ